jgi:hypothetical protein
MVRYLEIVDPISAIGALTLAIAAAADGYAKQEEGSKLRQMVDFMAMQAAMAARGRRHRGSYTSVVDYILDRGKHYPVRQLTQEQLAYLHQTMRSFGRPLEQKECFFNALMMLMYDFDDRLRYVEGYAHGQAPIPVHHAWVAIDGVPVEVTWRDFDSGTGPWIQPPSDFAYLGVEFDKKPLIHNMFEREVVYPVIDDWKAGWPELQKPRLRALPGPDTSGQ